MTTWLLLHGFTGGPEAWDDVALPPGRVVRPELGGHGEVEPVAWHDELSRIDAALGPGPRDVHVVGYSMGGRLGWGLLDARHPRLARATLIGAHPGLTDERERRARRDADLAWSALLEDEGVEAFAVAWEALPMWASQRSVPAPRLARRRAVRRRHDPRRLAGALRHLGLGAMPLLDPVHVEVPVTLVVGALDAKHRAIASRLAPAVGADLEIVEGAGHDPTLEQPEALAALLARREAA